MAMRFKTRILAVLTAAVLASTMAVAAEEPSEQVKRMDAAATVLDEIMGTPDKGIPRTSRFCEVRGSHTVDGQNRFCLRRPARKRHRDLPYQLRMECACTFHGHRSYLGIA